MKVIGLCGGSGSGKGLACSYFLKNGIKTIDTDRIYHDLTSSHSECLNEIALTFGDEVVSNGALDRKKLAEIVFASEGRLSTLNLITHKHILAEVRSRINAYEKLGETAVIVDAPVLFESGFDKECDITLAILANEKTRLGRIILRDNITSEKAEKRIRSQKSDEWLSTMCDHVIYNDKTEADLEQQINEFIKKYI